ncbi:OLC1v1028294C1 [Oldenlandia corymbosa var. corymbosa]|uniref:OLC1v1028294C1 n=1 Tax=Oldenlandia corymbosa var. corymbosa TaxID=529605 RepID=A0AAV1CBN2_OLDCO|nr:OLC1v1028294C1 [Oldenlandia corymbosa var. corymbosa]
MQASSIMEDKSSEATRRMIQDFENNLRLSATGEQSGEESQDEEEYNSDDEEEEFSFVFDSGNFGSPISADDAFVNGQIKPVFPLFDQALLLPDGEDLESLMVKDRLPNVNRVFIPAEDADSNGIPETSSSSKAEDVVGPYCEWSSKVVEAAPDRCKKSNSTGFSKIWRFKDFMHRSNSDGRDAFVFLNHSAPSGSSSTAASGNEEKKAAKKGIFTLKKVNENGEVVGEAKVKKVKKSKRTAALSAHEAYMKSKAKDSDRRRSYLPYRPELVGLFTNVNGGGLTRNVHPY